MIKVEHPDDPDQSRGSGTDRALNRGQMGTSFLTQGSNKRSITLDLKDERGREILKRLALRADVLVENFRPGAFAKLGLGYEAMEKINPRLIYCSISAFGQDGPRRNQTAYDHVIQGTSGLMAMTGTEEVNPIKLVRRRSTTRPARWPPLRWRARCSSASAPARVSITTWPCSMSR